MNLDFVQTLITRHEGFRKTVYTDSKGNPTIGIGFNLADAGAEGTCKAHGLDLQALLAGFPILQIEAVSVRDDAILACKFAAQCQFPNWDTLPDNAQAVILDMLFNMGSTKFAEFQHMIAALRSAPPNFTEAAAQMKASAWYGEVGLRGKEDFNLMLGCAIS